MNGKNAAGVYFAVRSAFTGNYDYFKYNGSIRITEEAFAIHKNKWQFIELGKKYDARDLPYALAVNFLHFGTDAMWIENYLKDFQTHDIVWVLWKKWQENRIANFSNGISHGIGPSIQDSLGWGITSQSTFKLKMESTYPWKHIYQSFNNKVALMSTFYMLDNIWRIFNLWNNQMKGDFTWDEEYQRIQKFRPFFYNYIPISDINIRKSLNSLFTNP